MGRFAKGERHSDKERARCVYGFLSTNAANLVTTYFPFVLPVFRWLVGQKPDQVKLTLSSNARSLGQTS